MTSLILCESIHSKPSDSLIYIIQIDNESPLEQVNSDRRWKKRDPSNISWLLYVDKSSLVYRATRAKRSTGRARTSASSVPPASLREALRARRATPAAPHPGASPQNHLLGEAIRHPPAGLESP